MCPEGMYARVGFLREQKLAKRAVTTLRDSLYLIQASKGQPRKKARKRPKMKYQPRKNLLASKIWVLFHQISVLHRVARSLMLLFWAVVETINSVPEVVKSDVAGQKNVLFINLSDCKAKLKYCLYTTTFFASNYD